MNVKSNSEEYIAFLDENRNKIVSNRGGWRLGEAVWVSGHSMMEDLIGKKSYFSVLLLNLTQRMPEDRLAQWFEANFICLSYPDSRLWCNQIGTFAGSLRASPAAGICAGSLAADSRQYGGQALLRSAEFIQQAKVYADGGMPVKDIIETELNSRDVKTATKAAIPGYFRPFADADERVFAMEIVRKDLDFDVGPHLALANAVSDKLQEEYGEVINYAGYCSAFLSDHGFSTQEIYRAHSLWVNSGVHACYAEANDKLPETFMPLRCDDVEYSGVEERPVK